MRDFSGGRERETGRWGGGNCLTNIFDACIPNFTEIVYPLTAVYEHETNSQVTCLFIGCLNKAALVQVWGRGEYKHFCVSICNLFWGKNFIPPPLFLPSYSLGGRNYLHFSLLQHNYMDCMTISLHIILPS